MSGPDYNHRQYDETYLYFDYNDWDSDVADLHFISVADLQNLAGNNIHGNPLQIYKETATFDAQLIKKLEFASGVTSPLEPSTSNHGSQSPRTATSRPRNEVTSRTVPPPVLTGVTDSSTAETGTADATLWPRVITARPPDRSESEPGRTGTDSGGKPAQDWTNQTGEGRHAYTSKPSSTKGISWRKPGASTSPGSERDDRSSSVQSSNSTLPHKIRPHPPTPRLREPPQQSLHTERLPPFERSKSPSTTARPPSPTRASHQPPSDPEVAVSEAPTQIAGPRPTLSATGPYSMEPAASDNFGTSAKRQPVAETASTTAKARITGGRDSGATSHHSKEPLTYLSGEGLASTTSGPGLVDRVLGLDPIYKIGGGLTLAGSLMACVLVVFLFARCSRKKRHHRPKSGSGHRVRNGNSDPWHEESSPRFDDRSRFVVNLHQNPRSDTVIQIQGDQDVTGYKHVVLPQKYTIPAQSPTGPQHQLTGHHVSPPVPAAHELPQQPPPAERQWSSWSAPDEDKFSAEPPSLAESLECHVLTESSACWDVPEGGRTVVETHVQKHVQTHVQTTFPVSAVSSNSFEIITEEKFITCATKTTKELTHQKETDELDVSVCVDDCQSAQLCQTYSEDKTDMGIETSTMATEAKEEDEDITEASIVLEQDEGIESEEEIDPKAFKNLILRSVSKESRQSSNWSPGPTCVKDSRLAAAWNPVHNISKEQIKKPLDGTTAHKPVRCGEGQTNNSPNNSLGSDGNSPTITPPSHNLFQEAVDVFSRAKDFSISFSGSESECLI